MTTAKFDELVQLRLHALNLLHSLLETQKKDVCNLGFLTPWTRKLMIPAVEYLLHNATKVAWE